MRALYKCSIETMVNTMMILAKNYELISKVKWATFLRKKIADRFLVHLETRESLKTRTSRVFFGEGRNLRKRGA